MIWLIAKKDFLLNLLSVRLIIGFILCLVIIPFTIVASIDNYLSKMKVYEVEYKTAEQEFKEQRVWSGVRPSVVEKPAPLSIFSTGVKDNVGNKVRIEFDNYPLLPAGQASTRDNPFLNSFFSIDFARVIAILISLIALVFAYDTFTQEKEEGTMKLCLTGQVSRISFFFGKLFGLLVTLLPILIFCYLLACLIVLFNPGISFSAADWGGIALLFLTSIIYMIVFALIGMFISSLVKSSSSSIVICLLSWIWFLFLVPNISTYLAQTIAKTPLYDNVQNAINEYDKEFGKESREKEMELYKEYGDPSGFAWRGMWNRDGKTEMYGIFWGAVNKHLKYNNWRYSVSFDYADKKWTLQRNYLDQLEKQQKLQQAISFLSPSEIFRQTTKALCQTDAQSVLRQMEDVRNYRQTIIGYFKDNRLFESIGYFTPQPERLFVDEKDCMPNWGERAHEVFDTKDYEPETYPYLNVDNLPRFQSSATTTPAIVNEALGSLLLLLALIVVLLLGTVMTFMRYDVR